MIPNDNMKSYICKIRIYFLILIAFIYHSIAYSPELNIQYAEELQSNLKKNFVKYDNKNYKKIFIDKDTCIFVNNNSYELINDNDECIEFSSKFIKAEFSPTGVNDEEYLIIFRKKKGSDEVSYSYNNVDWYDIKPEKIIPEEKNKYNEFVDIINKSWQRKLFQYMYYSHTENPEIFVTPISDCNDNVYRYRRYRYYLDTLEEDYAEYPYYKLHINYKLLGCDDIEFTKYYRYDCDKHKVEVSKDNYKWKEVQSTKNYYDDMDGGTISEQLFMLMWKKEFHLKKELILKKLYGHFDYTYYIDPTSIRCYYYNYPVYYICGDFYRTYEGDNCEFFNYCGKITYKYDMEDGTMFFIDTNNDEEYFQCTGTNYPKVTWRMMIKTGVGLSMFRSLYQYDFPLQEIN